MTAHVNPIPLNRKSTDAAPRRDDLGTLLSQGLAGPVPATATQTGGPPLQMK